MGHLEYKNYIVLNFAYGTGPYLRTTDLAIAFNKELAQRGQARLGIIVPWVYGDKQKKVMLEEFAGHEKKYPGEILLDKKLGAILKSIFYGDSTYEAALKKWVKTARVISAKAKKYLAGNLELETLAGERKTAKGGDIVVELARSPRLRFDTAPAYFTSFCYLGEVLEKALGEKRGAIAAKKELLKAGAQLADWAEDNYKIHCLSYPATFSALDFSFNNDHRRRYCDEIIVPPIGPVPKLNNEKIKFGIFVTITGIPGLERLYAEARALGIALYCNDVKSVKGSIRALPHLISNNNIIFQFARAGWSSIWLSMIVSTPLVVPAFDSKDDPEIYFNNQAVEALGIGIVYHGEPLKLLIEKAGAIRRKQAALKERIMKKWGTLDGTAYCAKLFVDDFLSEL